MKCTLIKDFPRTEHEFHSIQQYLLIRYNILHEMSKNIPSQMRMTDANVKLLKLRFLNYSIQPKIPKFRCSVFKHLFDIPKLPESYSSKTNNSVMIHLLQYAVLQYPSRLFYWQQKREMFSWV